MVKLTRKTHEVIINFEKLNSIVEPVFFKFDYEQLDKRYLLPVPLFSKRLNTRVIPNSKALITEPRIEDSALRLYLEPKKIQINESRKEGKLESIAKILDSKNPALKEE